VRRCCRLARQQVPGAQEFWMRSLDWRYTERAVLACIIGARLVWMVESLRPHLASPSLPARTWLSCFCFQSGGTRSRSRRPAPSAAQPGLERPRGCRPRRRLRGTNFRTGHDRSIERGVSWEPGPTSKHRIHSIGDLRALASTPGWPCLRVRAGIRPLTSELPGGFSSLTLAMRPPVVARSSGVAGDARIRGLRRSVERSRLRCADCCSSGLRQPCRDAWCRRCL
jgi:hypothetical protein